MTSVFKEWRLNLLLILAGTVFTGACAGAPSFERVDLSRLAQGDPSTDEAIDRDFDGPGDEELENPDEPHSPPTDDDDDQAVCDPLDQIIAGDNITNQNGLMGQLSYLDTDAPIASSVYDFWNFDPDSGTYTAVNGMDATLFSQWVNVPTRRFEEGFYTLGNPDEALVQGNGEVLVENFGIRYESNLILGEAEPGEYEIAILSDDGAVLTLMGGASDGSDYILSNDGNHPTRMACATQKINLDTMSLLPLELFYHQGPRYHIAFIVMWRRLAEGESAGQDPTCGLSGNDKFFDFSTVPSTPRQAYLDLLDRGWEVIPPSSYLLPQDVINPCVD